MNSGSPLIREGGWTKGTLAFVYCCAMAAVFPLYLDDRYFNVIDAKLVYFLVHTVALSVALIIVFLSKYRKKRHAQTIPRTKFTAGEISVMIYALIGTLSTLLSDRRGIAFWGIPGRNNGLLLLLCCCGAYFLAARCFDRRYLSTILWVFLAGSIPVSLLAVLNHIGIDPLHLFAFLDHNQQPYYLSTIGNVNFLSTYLSLVGTLALYGFIAKENTWKRILHGVILGCCISGWYAAHSDSAYLALVVVLLAIICLPSFTVRQLYHILQFFALFFLIAGGFGLLDWFFLERVHLPRGLTALLIRPSFAFPVALGFLIIYLLGGLLLRYNPTLGDKSLCRAGRVMAIILVAGITLMAMWINLGDVQIPMLTKYLKFNTAWGSNRGIIWKLWLKVYRTEFTPLQWLLGSGSDTAVYHMYPAHSAEILTATGELPDTAHNEYLQTLVCLGVAGLVSWLTILFTHLQGLRKQGSAAKETAIPLSILAYAGQSVVNIAMPGALPLAFLLMGLGESRPADTLVQPKHPASQTLRMVLLLIFVELILVYCGHRILVQWPIWRGLA